MVNNPTENIGSFWYLMLEMFPDRLEFMKLMFLLETGTMYTMITFHIWKTFNVLDEQKLENDQMLKKRLSLLLNAICLFSFVKFTMNPYPTLDDLTTCVFVTLLNLKFILKEVQALILFQAGTIYAIMNSGFLWVTWLQRFSGNANFFYFQTLVMHSFLVVFFIQVYIAVDGKRKKYAKKIC